MLHATATPFSSGGHGVVALHVGLQIVKFFVSKNLQVMPDMQSLLAVVSVHRS